MKGTKVKQKNISIYPSDEALLLQIGKDNGLSSFSAAIRYIIHDWKRMKAQQADALAESRAHYILPEPTS